MARWVLVSLLFTASARADCVPFAVVTTDLLGNVDLGLPARDHKWLAKTLKKFDGFCYVKTPKEARLVFDITMTPAVYHGTRTEAHTTTSTGPVNATVTDSSGNSAQVSGTTSSTSTTYNTVPVTFDYSVYHLAIVDLSIKNPAQAVIRRFEQKGYYHALYGVPIGQGHHPRRDVIEYGLRWLDDNP